LIATGEWGVCLLSLDIRYMMFFGVNVQEIDKLRRKKCKSYVWHRRHEITLSNKYFLTQKNLFYHNLLNNFKKLLSITIPVIYRLFYLSLDTLFF